MPALPVLVALANIYLMTSLSALTWLLFGLWMSLGKEGSHLSLALSVSPSSPPPPHLAALLPVDVCG